MFLPLCFFGIITYFIVKFYAKVRSLPPGPFPLPIVGNVPQLIWGLSKEGSIVKLLQKWQKEYGDVYTWWLGPMENVNICDYRVAHDAMVKNGAVFASRPIIFFMNIFRKGRGLIISNGSYWADQRRFALHTLRNFGLGKNVMQERILLEYDYRTTKLDKEIESSDGTTNFDPYNMLELTTGNIINRLLFSERFTEDEEKRFFVLKKKLDEMMEKTNVFDIMMTEFTAKFPPFKQRLEIFRGPTEAVFEFIRGQIDLIKKEIEEGRHELIGEGEDFVDAYLIQMQKEDIPEGFDEESLLMTCSDLWSAGQETTATSLYWAVAYLIQHPEVIKKMRKELDEVTGRTRHLSLTDKSRTQYFNAVVLECLRLSSIILNNIWREAGEDTVIGGHHIPKGTTVTAQPSLLMLNSKQFDEPEKFKPERFLENSLEQFVVPFGMGKRACPGESLARAELYLLIGNLFLHYNIEEDPSHPASMKAISDMGGIRKAQRFHVNVSKRG